MAEPLKEHCQACIGEGIILHVKRKMANGEPDPSDLKMFDLCEKCSGSGRILLDKSRIKEPGNIADKAVVT